jgi:hypothetical protein
LHPIAKEILTAIFSISDLHQLTGNLRKKGKYSILKVKKVLFTPPDGIKKYFQKLPLANFPRCYLKNFSSGTFYVVCWRRVVPLKKVT